MKPDWLDPDVWTVSDEDRETGVVRFALAAAVFVIWLIVGYLYLVLFAVAQ